MKVTSRIRLHDGTCTLGLIVVMIATLISLPFGPVVKALAFDVICGSFIVMALNAFVLFFVPFKKD